MADYVRIDHMQDVGQAYSEIIRIFGRNILNDKYRMVGAFLDIAPKLKEEAEHLLQAFEAEVPQYFVTASGLDKAKAAEFVKKLSAKGIPNETAMDLLENLSNAVGIKANIRPDYSKGGEIPYCSKPADGLQYAIQKLDHIRWFLNNSNRYHWHGSGNECKDMRKLMNNAQRNEAELVQMYERVVHKFQNDPFASCVVFKKGKESEIDSTDFGAYFIVVGGTPVALEFARMYGGAELSKGMKSFRSKYETAKRQVESYHNEAASIPVASQGGKSGKGKAVAFIIVSLVLLYLVRSWFLFRFSGMGLMSFWGALKNCHFAIWKVISGIPLVSHPVGYSVILIVSGLILLCAVILIINLFKTIRNIARAKGSRGPVNKKNKLVELFGKTIPGKLDAMFSEMQQYASGKKKALQWSRQDYSSYVGSIETLRNTKLGSSPSALVSSGGKVALGWMIALSIILSIMSATKLRSAAMSSGSEIASVVTLKETLADTTIPSNALQYGDHYYAIFDDATSWSDAFYQCEKLGGHLVTIGSEEEEIAVAGYIKNLGLDTVYMGLMYLNGSDGTPNWYWYGMETPSYTDWTVGEPDIGDEGDCIYGAFHSSDNYQWRALSDEGMSYYMCEWESVDAGRVDTRLLNVPVGSLAYNGHYYAILTGADSYDDAVKMCEKLGGYMCMIDNAEENTVLYDYMHSCEYDSAFFGYSDQDLEGKWLWSYTGALGDYENWNEGEPNGDTSENYGMFYYSSAEYTWNDGDWGGDDAPFFCEWDLTQPEAEE